jgi:hypothetical protein
MLMVAHRAKNATGGRTNLHAAVNISILLFGRPARNWLRVRGAISCVGFKASSASCQKGPTDSAAGQMWPRQGAGERETDSHGIQRARSVRTGRCALVLRAGVAGDVPHYWDD